LLAGDAAEAWLGTDFRGSDHFFRSIESRLARPPIPLLVEPAIDGLTKGLLERGRGSPPAAANDPPSGKALVDGRSNFGRSMWCSSKAGGGMNGGLIGAMMLGGSQLVGAPMDGRLPNI